MQQSVRGFIRERLRNLLANPRHQALAATLLRPAIRRSFGLPGHDLLWGMAEQTVNFRSVSVQGKTWFGDSVDCDLSDMIEQRIFYFGVWEPDISRLFRQHLQPGDVFVDAGANVGYFSLLGARLVGPAGHGVAIEAWPPTAEKLQRNLARNGVTNVAVHQVAIAKSRGTITINQGRPGNLGTSSLEPVAGSKASRAVSSLPLFDLLPPEDLPRIGLIKLDIEGAEVAALAEILEHSGKLNPRLAVVAEVTPAIFTREAWPVEQVLEDFAYRGFSAQIVLNDYALDRDWHRFDPAAAPRLASPSPLPAARFDMILTRNSL